MALSRGRRVESVNYWPGFVDALSTMLLVIIFLLSVFMLAQFFLSREVTGKDTALAKLNQQIEELTSLLAIERSQQGEDQAKIASLTATLDASQAERKQLLDAAAQGGAGAEAAARQDGRRRQCDRRGAPDFGQARSPRSTFSISRSTPCASSSPRSSRRSMRRKPPTRTRRPRSPTSGSASTSRWRRRCRSSRATAPTSSDACRQILGARPDIRVVGDRFVFESSVLFDSGKADISSAGHQSLDSLASAVLDLEREIPPDIPWILRVDGHTDSHAISSSAFKSNWELSAARAISVVQYLVSKGIEPNRLVAAGFGEFQPIDPGTDEEALAHNRRIELKLTER